MSKAKEVINESIISIKLYFLDIDFKHLAI